MNQSAILILIVSLSILLHGLGFQPTAKNSKISIHNFKRPVRSRCIGSRIKHLHLNQATSVIPTEVLGNPSSYLLNEKLLWLEDGYKTWTWNGHKINYVDVGGESDSLKPPLLLIHGFGASVYHWRYNIPFLSQKYHVYAVDLLGFGLSDKPILDYNAEVIASYIEYFLSH